MTLNDVITSLGIEESYETLRIEWDSSQQAMPKGEISYLTDIFLFESANVLGYPKKIIGEITHAAHRIKSSQGHKALFWHFYHCLYDCPNYSRDNLRKWPSISALKSSLQEDANMFYYVVLLSGIPKITERMENISRMRSIPSVVIKDTLKDMVSDLDVYKKEHGGLPPASLGFRVYTNFGGEYFRFGRLAFHINAFKGLIRVFQHRNNGTVIALAKEGVSCLENGQLDGPRRKKKAGDIWTTEFTINTQKIIGYPVLPEGRTDKKEICLKTEEWEQVLAYGDTVIDIHIPGGEPMNFEQCGESMEKAIKFFECYFPERTFVAFNCISWLMDSQLQELIANTSNIARFQKEFYLFPALSDDEELLLLKKAFGYVPIDFESVQCKTSLQQALKKKILEGRDFYTSAGGGFLLFKDFEWGTQVYLKQKLEMGN
jgi:hypothetical protein